MVSRPTGPLSWAQRKHLEPQAAKTKWRKTLLQQRLALSQQEWQRRSQDLCAHLQGSALFRQATTVLAYISTRQEPDLSPLFRLPNLTWGLPRCQGDQLTWHRCQPADLSCLERGKYGIWEPKPDLPELPVTAVDLILVPAVACDHQGYRLGYGGGFYDRCLSQPAWRSIPTLGIVFDFAYVSNLPHAEWDIPLQAVCTDQGWMGCHI